MSLPECRYRSTCPEKTCDRKTCQGYEEDPYAPLSVLVPIEPTTDVVKSFKEVKFDPDQPIPHWRCPCGQLISDLCYKSVRDGALCGVCDRPISDAVQLIIEDENEEPKGA